jgi:hypothetical protein
MITPAAPKVWRIVLLDMRNRDRNDFIGLTRKSSADAGGDERGKHDELFHKIKWAHRDGQRW